jgi:hypothetical protein
MLLITDNYKQSDKGAALFGIRVDGVVMHYFSTFRYRISATKISFFSFPKHERDIRTKKVDEQEKMQDEGDP